MSLALDPMSTLANKSTICSYLWSLGIISPLASQWSLPALSYWIVSSQACRGHHRAKSLRALLCKYMFFFYSLCKYLVLLFSVHPSCEVCFTSSIDLSLCEWMHRSVSSIDGDCQVLFASPALCSCLRIAFRHEVG